MSDESTVLFVATDRLPEGLSSQLERKNVFLEEAKLDHLGPAVVATAPDLVVFIGSEKAEQVFAELGDQQIPVAVIAERGAHKELRQIYGTKIAALIPRELPIAALTHRLMTLARRAASGEKLQASVSLAPGPARAVAAPRTTTGTTGTTAGAQRPSGTGGSPAPGPAVASKNEPKRDEQKEPTRKDAPGRLLESKLRGSPGPDAQREQKVPKVSSAARTGRGAGVGTVAAATAERPPPGDQLAGAGKERTAPTNIGVQIDAAAEGGRRGAGLRQVQFPSINEPRGASLRAQRGAPSPSPQFGAARTGAAATDQDRASRADAPLAEEAECDDLGSMQTATFELPVEVRRLARQRSQPPPGKGSTGRSMAPSVPSGASPATPSHASASMAPVAVAKTRLAFDRTLVADGFGAGSPCAEPEAAPLTPRDASSGFEAPVPPKVGTFAGEGDAAGADRGDLPSTRERTSSSADADLAQPTPEQTRRMQDAEALAAKIRRSTVAVSAIRVVVCDDDFTRADAITSELREHGLDVMMLSPDYQKARWGVLRRYAPHGLLVDERSLSKGGRQIVGTFRRDPFLKYVPLVAIRFDRLFREDEVRVNLAPLFPLLQPLGREELTLLDRLTISGNLTVDLSQVLPNRLVELLGAYEHTCALECKSGGQRLTWPISGGFAGKAELMDQPGSAGLSLKAEDALRWLLAQDEPQITIAQRPQIRLSHPEAIAPLLERVTSSIEPPSEHSIAPPKGGRKVTGGSYAHTLIGVAPAAAPPLSGPAGMPTVPAPLQPGPGAPAGRMVVEARLPRDMAALTGNSSAVGEKLGRFAASARSAWESVVHVVRPGVAHLREFILAKTEQWPPYLYWTVAVGVGLVGLLLLVSILMMCSSSASKGEGGQEPGAAAEDGAPGSRVGGPRKSAGDAGSASARTKAATGGVALPSEPSADPGVIGKANQAALGRFRVAPDKPSADCKDLVREPTHGSAREAAQYWKAARAKLVQGNSKQAQELMCRSALIEPGGHAAEGLVGYYLGQRSLSQAEAWVRRVLAAAPDRRTAQELLSDIKNQQGDPEVALDVLLGTLKLSADDQRKRGIVARKFTTDARAAVRSGDLPRAERLLRRAVILDPESAEIGVELAQLYLRLDLTEPARLWAQDVLVKNEGDPGAHLVLGDIARLARDYPTARRHYAAVLPGAPGAGRAQGYLQDMPR